MNDGQAASHDTVETNDADLGYGGLRPGHVCIHATRQPRDMTETKSNLIYELSFGRPLVRFFPPLTRAKHIDTRLHWIRESASGDKPKVKLGHRWRSASRHLHQGLASSTFPASLQHYHERVILTIHDVSPCACLFCDSWLIVAIYLYVEYSRELCTWHVYYEPSVRSCHNTYYICALCDVYFILT